jgi:hypothetical protein
MKRLLLIAAVCVAFLAGPAQAQDAPTLSSLEISIWPEFDRPEVLVIYRGLLSADIPLPAPVEIRIPARVGQPTAVAYVDEAGQRLNQQYTTRLEDDWLVVSFELVAQGFQLEYYDLLPVDSAGQREYTYAYEADYDIASLSVEFQVPPTAAGFAVDPQADSVGQETDGLTYHQVTIQSLARGQQREWKFTYQKNNTDLTVSAFVEPEAPAPVTPPAADGTDGSTVLIFVIAFVALVAVGAGAFWLGRRTQPLPRTAPQAARKQKRRGSGRGAQARPSPAPRPSGTDTLFCYQCGVRLRPDSEFCHKCGAAVRGE